MPCSAFGTRRLLVPVAPAAPVALVAPVVPVTPVAPVARPHSRSFRARGMVLWLRPRARLRPQTRYRAPMASPGSPAPEHAELRTPRPADPAPRWALVLRSGDPSRGCVLPVLRAAVPLTDGLWVTCFP